MFEHTCTESSPDGTGWGCLCFAAGCDCPVCVGLRAELTIIDERSRG